MDRPTTEKNLVLKVFVGVAMAFAARGCESSCVEVPHVSASYNEDREEESYKIMYGRKKVDGPKETEGDVDNPEFSKFLALFFVLNIVWHEV